MCSGFSPVWFVRRGSTFSPLGHSPVVLMKAADFAEVTNCSCFGTDEQLNITVMRSENSIAADKVVIGLTTRVERNDTLEYPASFDKQKKPILLLD